VCVYCFYGHDPVILGFRLIFVLKPKHFFINIWMRQGAFASG
jgi:hypothetical protein